MITGFLFAIHFSINIFCLFFVVLAYGQQEDSRIIDSIKTASPENLDSLYYNLFVKYRVNDPDLSEEYALLSYELSKSSNDYNYWMRSLNALGLCKQKQTKF